MRILVSACLLGINSRYCGGGCFNKNIASLITSHDLIPVCPEQLGGLPTPREPDEIREGKGGFLRKMDKTTLKPFKRELKRR